MTTSALATRDGGALATSEARFTPEDIELIRQTVCTGASDAEFKLFLNQAVRTGLDPLARQIYSIPRKGGRTIQTGIDGYRLIAERTGLYAGSDDPVYDSEEEKQPRRATVTVWKLIAGERCAFTATARWDEYKPPAGQDTMWQKMPYLMLAKCAEALALRKAFPQELSGIYTETEMAQAAEAPPRERRTALPAPAPPVRASIMNTPRVKPSAPSVPSPAFTGQQVSLFWATAHEHGWAKDEVRKAMGSLCPERLDPARGEVSLMSLTRAEYDGFLALFRGEMRLTPDPDGDDFILVPVGPPDAFEEEQPV